MKKNKKIIESFLFLLFSLLLLLTSTLAWFSINTGGVDVDDLINQVGSYSVDTNLQVKKNDGDWVIITTDQQLEILLSNTVPADAFYFRLTISNTGTESVVGGVQLSDITSLSEEEGFDMRDVFYLVDGACYVDEALQEVTPNSSDVITLYEGTIYEQELSLYRFSNITSSGIITLATGITVGVGESVLVSFQIAYDSDTSNEGYQNGIFQINTIQLYFS
ncbi:MAG: hypothetical protein RBS25_01240 [Bacilli bacterium]|jgi:hypothetical protein|nr:hypothetical protein [Bacilli bacterium]